MCSIILSVDPLHTSVDGFANPSALTPRAPAACSILAGATSACVIHNKVFTCGTQNIPYQSHRVDRRKDLVFHAEVALDVECDGKYGTLRTQETRETAVDHIAGVTRSGVRLCLHVSSYFLHR